MHCVGTTHACAYMDVLALCQAKLQMHAMCWADSIGYYCVRKVIWQLLTASKNICTPHVKGHGLIDVCAGVFCLAM